MDDEASALLACARGEHEALRRLFDMEAAKMLGVAIRILRRRDLAEEAVQDTFVRIWRHAARFDPARGSARAWIYAILRNRALTILRQADRETAQSPAELEERSDQAVIQAAWFGLDESHALKRCLEELDEAKRQGILMAYVLGYTHGEIAGRLGAPLGTTKAWVRRGLKMLRECLS